MRWVWLAALANKWLWLVAGFATALLVVLGTPVAFAIFTGLATLGTGAYVGYRNQITAAQSTRLPGRGRPEPPQITDRYAQAVIQRAQAAAGRIEKAEELVSSAPSALALDVGFQADNTLAQIYSGAGQVDRLNLALLGIEPAELSRELDAVTRSIASDSPGSAELKAERKRTADGLRSQLDTYTRVADQRLLLLERMRAAAVGLENLASRSGELAALYQAHGTVDTTGRDIEVIGGELEDLRESLLEAQKSVRAALTEGPETTP